MKSNSHKIAVIFYGPPGSGKGTQANLLSEKLGLFHFDTGAYLRAILNDPRNKKNKEIQKEKKLNESGKLNSPEWVSKVVHDRIKELSSLGQSVILSGSPRTKSEAFGDVHSEGLLKLLEEEFGKKNIYIFALNIPENETVKRNSKRRVCSICHTGILAEAKSIKSCPVCGGEIEHRKDDKKDVIVKRLKEYHERTEPILSGMIKRKYKVVKLDGTPAPFKIHQKILGYFK